MSRRLGDGGVGGAGSTIGTFLVGYSGLTFGGPGGVEAAQVITIDDPLGAYTDVVSVNEYLGWYGGLPSHCQRAQWETSYDKPLIISETGAGALGKQLLAGREIVHGIAVERRLLRLVPARDKPAPQRVVVGVVHGIAGGIECPEAHPVSVPRQLFVQFESDVAVGIEGHALAVGKLQ